MPDHHHHRAPTHQHPANLTTGRQAHPGTTPFSTYTPSFAHRNTHNYLYHLTSSAHQPTRAGEAVAHPHTSPIAPGYLPALLPSRKGQSPHRRTSTSSSHTLSTHDTSNQHRSPTESCRSPQSQDQQLSYEDTIFQPNSTAANAPTNPTPCPPRHYASHVLTHATPAKDGSATFLLKA
jgi:hypothetical protein